MSDRIAGRAVGPGECPPEGAAFVPRVRRQQRGRLRWWCSGLLTPAFSRGQLSAEILEFRRGRVDTGRGPQTPRMRGNDYALAAGGRARIVVGDGAALLRG